MSVSSHPSGGSLSVPLGLISKQEIETGEPVITGWSFHINEHGVVECKGDNVCAPINSGNHSVSGLEALYGACS